MFEITVQTQSFDPWKRLMDFEKTLTDQGNVGACSVFTGTMRDFNDNQVITHMHLEHYPGMTEQFLQTLLDETGDRHQLVAGLIVHRVGDIKPSDTIVLVAAWSGHRREAFIACKHLIETLKHQAPFWKKETLIDESCHWVQNNTPG